MSRLHFVVGMAVAFHAAGLSERAEGVDLEGKTSAQKKSGHYVEAAKVYLAVIGADSKDAASYNALAWIEATCPEAACRDGKSAVAHATRACELTDWKNHAYLDTLAAAYAEQQDFDNATLWQGLAVEQAPAALKPDFAARLALFHKSRPFREDPQNLPAGGGPDTVAPQARFRYGTIEECSAEIARNPNEVSAYAFRGKLWLAKKAHDKALADYTRAIQLEPANADHRRGRAAVYRAMGETAKAVADEAAFHAARALEHVRNQEFAEAIQDNDAAIKLAPSSPRAYNQLAWLRATCPDAAFRDGKAAVASALKACELTAYKNYLYLDTLAAAYAESGDFDEAVTWEFLAAEHAPAGRKKMINDHLALFQKSQPYREDAR
jgi:tetratricopeptide (TPR) repeat protein